MNVGWPTRSFRGSSETSSLVFLSTRTSSYLDVGTRGIVSWGVIANTAPAEANQHPPHVSQDP